mmetsp:Transcript_706/g.1466  ORF Transcript_706/g.1466 Transcript_706/m.1466 type:complete len:291 (+) Transcript_706:555-1427(+)
MRASIPGVGGAERVVWCQARLHVVCSEDGISGGIHHALCAKHCAEHPGNACDARLSPRCSRHGSQVTAAWHWDHGVVGQVWCQVGLAADWAQTGATATMGNAEGLVQVQVAHISADYARRSETQLCIHVGTIHVDLATELVDGVADLLDVVLKESPCGWIRDHEGCQVVLVCLAQLAELTHVHALGILNPLDLHAAHHSTCRVGSVSRLGNDADVPVAFALGFQVLPDDKKTSILARCSTGWLERACIESGAADEELLEGAQHLTVALSLALWCKWVHVGNLGPTARCQR